MRARDLLLALDPDSLEPLYLQVAGSLRGAILDGRVAPGSALPGIREIAARLGVHRNTVVAALRELEAEGLLELRERSGAFVRARPAERRAQPREAGGERGFEIGATLKSITGSAARIMDLRDGYADPRLMPLEALAQAHRRGLRLRGPELLEDGDPRGLPRLREALAQQLAERRGLVAAPEQILLLRGSRAAVELLGLALAGDEGGDFAVEDPGHPQAWEALRRVPGARLYGLPVDRDGACVERLEGAPRLLLLSPQCQFPTGAPLAPERRRAVLALARERRFPVLELDLECEHLAAPAATLAAEDGWRQVIYLGSLSRVLASGLELAYLVAPPWLAERLAALKRRLGWRGDPVLEWAVAELLLDGSFALHLRRLRKASAERRAAMAAALRGALPGRLAFDETVSGMALWVEGRGDWAAPERLEAAIESARRSGLRFGAGRLHTLDAAPLAAARIGFSHLEPSEIATAVRVLAAG